MVKPRVVIILFASLVLIACSKPVKTEDAGLIAAARTGHAGTVRDLLAAGANINVRDEHANTPLIEAARNGHDDVVRTLLAAGADAKLVNDDGKTALMLAQQGGHDDVVRALREAGVRTGSP
jgi:ankyrin repeat protein